MSYDIFTPQIGKRKKTVSTCKGDYFVYRKKVE